MAEFLVQRSAREIDRHVARASSVSRRSVPAFCANTISEISTFSPRRCRRSAIRQLFRVDDRLKAEAGHDPGKLFALRSGARGHVGADHPDVGKIGMRLKVACKLLQRNRDRVLHLPRPGDRCSILRHRGHMLVPEMQSHDPLAPLQARAVVQGETLGRTGDIDAETNSNTLNEEKKKKRSLLLIHVSGVDSCRGWRWRCGVIVFRGVDQCCCYWVVVY